jgi:hypothetical protein
MQPIADWLEKLGLAECTQRFIENGIDLSVLQDLMHQDLKEMGTSELEEASGCRQMVGATHQ